MRDLNAKLIFSTFGQNDKNEFGYISAVKLSFDSQITIQGKVILSDRLKSPEQHIKLFPQILSVDLLLIKKRKREIYSI